MRVAIVYDSSTGTTKAVAEQMGEVARGAGHECTVDSIHDADPAAVSAADVICVGSWTKGLYVIRQGPTQATIDFIGRLEPLEGKQVAVFTTYAIAVGKTLKKMASPLEARGGDVTGLFKSKGPNASADFATWLRRLDT
jgi:flavodoxin